MRANRRVLGLALALLMLAPVVTYADLVYNATLDTAPLVGNAAGPFSLDFQLVGTGNNTVTLSNFQFGGGAADTFGTGLFDTSYSTGEFSGNLNSSVTLTDSANFYNEFTQQVTPGSTLTFKIDLTTNNVNAVTPDQFSFGILDKGGNDIPMPANDPYGAYLVLTLNSSTNPQVQTFGNDPTTPDSASGMVIGATGPLQLSAIPEPSSLTLLVGVMTALCGWKLRCGKRRRT